MSVSTKEGMQIQSKAGGGIPTKTKVKRTREHRGEFSTAATRPESSAGALLVPLTQSPYGIPATQTPPWSSDILPLAPLTTETRQNADLTAMSHLNPAAALRLNGTKQPCGTVEFQ